MKETNQSKKAPRGGRERAKKQRRTLPAPNRRARERGGRPETARRRGVGSGGSTCRAGGIGESPRGESGEAVAARVRDGGGSARTETRAGVGCRVLYACEVGPVAPGPPVSGTARAGTEVFPLAGRARPRRKEGKRLILRWKEACGVGDETA